jgi:hypothetical protein
MGTMKYRNGSLYNGNWEKGKQQGQGKFEFSNGDRYEGYW